MKLTWRTNFHVFFAATCIWIGMAVSGFAQGDPSTIFLRDIWIAVLTFYLTWVSWELSKLERLHNSN